MMARNQLLENHSVLVRDGRILDILPTAAASQTYLASVVLQRPTHMLIPGFINTHADITTALLKPTNQVVRNNVLLAIAEMLRSGVTCFGDRGRSPDETARTAVEQGMRAVIGIPVGAPDSLTDALNLRDAYRGHALISTVFAPHSAQQLDDDAFSRLIILADEIDAGITIDLHATSAEVADSLHRYGRRPIERLWQLGLLTPALNAVHMVHATAADAELARRTGISVSFCPRADLKRGEGLPPIDAFSSLDMRLSLGSAGAVSASHDLWGDLQLTALMTHAASTLAERSSAWDALLMATRGGAEALGLDAEIGTVEPGKVGRSVLR